MSRRLETAMKHSTTELASRISRAMISASDRTWNPLLEQTLHGIGCRQSLDPTLVSRVIDPFLINHHSLALGFFNWASQQPGFTHTSVSYQSMLKSLAISRQFNALDRLLKQIKTLEIQLHPSVYRSVIASYLAGKKTLNAFSVFSDVRSLVSDIGTDTCNSLVAALSSDGNMVYAQKVFDDMTQRGVPLSTLGLGVFIRRFCTSAEVGKTLSLLDEVREQDRGVNLNGSILALLVVHGLCLGCRVQEAMYMLDALRKRGFKPDFMAYRIVAEALRATGNVADVEKVLKMKRKLGVAPRSSDYRDFIFQLISERLIWEAKDLGEVIVNGNFPIEDDVLNALIGSVSANDPCFALTLFKFLVGKERLPTLVTFSNLSRNLCKHGKHEELVQVSEILSAREYFVDLERCKLMVSLFCKAGKVKEAYEFLQDMKKKGLSPDVSFYNSIMEACCREDLIRPAKRLWDEMFANGCEPNLMTCNILIGKFAETGKVEEANRLLCRMMERGVEPDATTYAFLLQGHCQQNQLQTALEIFTACFQRNAATAQTVLGKFILYLCQQGEFMAASNLVHDYTCSIAHLESQVILLKCLADAGEVAVAIQHVKRLGASATPMLSELRAELLSMLAASSNPQPILELVGAIESLK